MRSNTFNFAENLLGRILFASFYTLVTSPWLNIIFRDLVGVRIQGLVIWFGLAVIIGGIVLQLSHRIRQDLLARVFVFGMIPILAYVLSQIVFRGFEHVTDYGAVQILGAVAMVIYLLLGFRYHKIISGQTEFMSEFSLLAVVMLFNLILNNKLNLGIGYQQILYFFITGIALGTYRKFKEIQAGAEKSTHSWFVVTVSVAVFVSLFAAILTFGFSEEAVTVILAPIIALLKFLREALLVMVMYALTVIGPVMEFIFSKLKMPDRSNSVQERWESFESFSSEMMGVDQGVAVKYPWLPWVLLLLVVFTILLIVVKRLQRNRDQQKGYDEQRESVFTAAEMKDDFRNMFQSLTRRFQRKQGDPSIYDGSSNALRIREIYYRFITRFHPRIPFRKFYTPKDYLSKVQGLVPEQPASELTNIYEQARYSREVDSADVERMEQAYEQLTDEPSVSQKRN